MNSYPGHVWDIPPPPGTAEEITNSYVQNKQDQSVQYNSRSRSPYYSTSRNRSSHRYSPHRYRTRRRSRSRSRDRRWRRSRSRSVSRGRRNRSRSVSRNRSHTNRSRSRSRKRYSRSRSPRRSVTSSSHSPSSNMSLAKSDNETDNDSGSDEAVRSAQEYAARALAAVASSFNKSTTSTQNAVSPDIPFKNDGSFLEMFKRMQEEQRAQEGEPQVDSSTSSRPVPSASIVGKRRGGRILKTGIVEKKRTNLAEDEPPKDAWSVYMKEVRRYKEACCDDDSKTRPLVK